MRIDNNKMWHVLKEAENADIQNIKALSETERRTIKIMAEAVRQGKTSIDVKDKTFKSIEVKLQTPQAVISSSFIEKIIKFFQNIFGLRTSSASVIKDVAASSRMLTKNIAALEKVKRKLKKKLEALGLAEKDQFESLRNEIEKLSIEKANLESFLFPREDQTKIAFEKRRQEMEVYKKQIPGFLAEARRMLPEEEQRKAILGTVNDQKNQFERDYIRQGVTLKMTDSQKGTFEGFHKFENPEENLRMHLEAFDRLFAPHEEIWKSFVKEVVTQTPFNFLFGTLHPLHIDSGSGARREVAGGLVLFPSSEAEKIADVTINRDRSGNITSVDIKTHGNVPIQISNERERPIDTIGTLQSSLTFTLIRHLA